MDYDRLSATAARLLAASKRGDVAWLQIMSTPGETELDEPTVTETRIPLDAVVTGVSAEFVDNSTVLASDRQVICAPVAGIGPGSMLEIDGKRVTVMQALPVLAAGDPVILKLIVRG